jgi:hypothetical protein
MPGLWVRQAVMVSTLYIFRRINIEILFKTPGRFNTKIKIARLLVGSFNGIAITPGR